MALLIRDFLEHHKADYTLSVYNRELSLSAQDVVRREDLAAKTGLTQNKADTPILRQLLQAFRDVKANTHQSPE